MTGEEWDVARWRIYDLVRDGVSDDSARRIADDECAEQFGPRPEDVAS